ncbi:preprotein translocase subunit SecA [Buchnera aphidicola]|uniref:preprotein translocase subunit SecA n=1 Tax=Buchnera aphidicola TaxID=9 RepID=UPI0030EE0BFA
MLFKYFKNFFISRNEKILNKLYKIVEKINLLESKYQKYSDKELKNQTFIFKNELKKKKSLNDILIESYAVVRESSKRVFGMRHFDVQLLGGIVLHQNCIAEMKTGEGKTLTSTLPIYLNSLEGKGVHVVTMNDYLAKRDAEKNQELFNFLGLTVGLNSSNISIKLKQKAYNSDITYGTNNEYGFDYLRDNMIFHKKNRIQRNLNYALIDEVDSILIDESRTPLIISGEAKESAELYNKINFIVKHLIEQKKGDSYDFSGGDFSIDEKSRQIYLTEKGLTKVENLLIKNKILKMNESLYSLKNLKLMHYIISALKAHKLFIKNIDYLVKNNEIIVVDEHTGRIVKGRRWSEGLHQSIEAKEKVPINNENKTLASITFQNYFRLYQKLSGMTGTAKTESFEFYNIYNLDTVVIPTHTPMIRKDYSDVIFLTEKEKLEAIIKDIKKCVLKKQPVLVGTISIEKSEKISFQLKKNGIKHNVLNAKFHDQEAKIISQAGSLGAVTIATNMAGRGTDIVLGGALNIKNFSTKKAQIKKNLKKYLKKKKKWKKFHSLVLSVGGLHVIGTERHESRRIDNQLRGRAGRQGDIGSSRFYISMEDFLMRIFISDNIIFLLRKLGMKYGDSIQHSWVNKAIANAQKKVEIRNFEMRKQLLEYDNVINEQRKVIYAQRNNLINSNDITKIIRKISKDVFCNFLNKFFNDKKYKYYSKEIFLKNIENSLKKNFDLQCSFNFFHIKKNIFLEKNNILKLIIENFKLKQLNQESLIGKKNIRSLEINIMLSSLDIFWQDHLSSMDYLKQGINLRGYAQKDPIQEYKKESFLIFSEMLDLIKYDVIKKISLLKINSKNFLIDLKNLKKKIKFYYEKTKKNDNFFVFQRNKLCFCNSGKKYKHCHGVFK